MYLNDKQVQWEKDWCKRFYAAVGDKDKDTVSMFLAADATFVQYGAAPLQGREAIAEAICGSSTPPSNWRVRNELFVADAAYGRLVILADVDAPNEAHPDENSFLGRIVTVIAKDIGREQEQLKSMESIMSANVLGYIVVHFVEQVLEAEPAAENSTV